MTVTSVFEDIETNAAVWKNWSDIKGDITEIIADDPIKPAALYSDGGWFQDMSSLTSVDLEKFDTSDISNLDYVFARDRNLQQIRISSWDTSQVLSMQGAFVACSSLSSVGDLSLWDTSQVTTLSNAFNSCSSLTDLDSIAGWDTSQVTTLSKTFNSCSSLTSLDLATWDISRVTNLSYVFTGCSSLTDLDSIAGWDTSQVTTLSNAFNSCSSLTSLDLATWDTSKVTDLSRTFNACLSLETLDLSGWDTSQVKNMTEMFYACKELTTIYASNRWSIESVTSGNNTFFNNVKLVGGNGTPFNSSYRTFTRAQVDKDGQVGYLTFKRFGPIVPEAQGVYFEEDNSLHFVYANPIEKGESVIVVDSSGTTKSMVATEVYTDIETDPNAYTQWSNKKSSIEEVIVDNNMRPAGMGGTSSATAWFGNLAAVTYMDLRKFEVGDLHDLSFAFSGNGKLQTIKIDSWDTSQVTSLKGTFNGCSSLATLDLSDWDTSQSHHSLAAPLRAVPLSQA